MIPEEKYGILLDIPDIEDHEAETLYIIGNGFDRAHQLRTSYKDFRIWLLGNGHQDFVESIESIYDNGDKARFSDEEKLDSLLWKDFEAALGKINANSARNHLDNKFGNVVDDQDALNKAIAEIQIVVTDVFLLIYEWSKSVGISSVQRIYNLSPKSKYLSFNYTETLENCYGIPQSQILHIHGKVSDNDVIVGCERDIIRQPGEGTQKERRYAKRINTIMNHLNKPVDEIIGQHEAFFQSLSSVNRVVVLGHSFSDIDIPYLEEVMQNVSKESHWHFSVFNDIDYQKLLDFIKNSMGGIESMLCNNYYVFNVRQIPVLED